MRFSYLLLLVSIFASSLTFAEGLNHYRLEDDGVPTFNHPSKVGDDIPRKGNSLFEILVAKWGGIPYPFEKFLEKLSQETGYRMPVGMFHHSRSLQRHATSAAFPRLVVSPKPFKQVEGVAPGEVLEGKIYIGFAEKAEAIEVISFNEVLARFEFQIVEDYKEGASPKLYYAPRALCVSCHQSQGPIFPVLPWTETNVLRRRAEQMIDLIGKNEYMGTPIYKRARPDEHPIRQADRSILFGQTFWRESKLSWEQMCKQTETRETYLCRKKLFLLSLNALCRDDLDRVKELKLSLQNFARRSVGEFPYEERFQFIEPQILDFQPGSFEGPLFDPRNPNWIRSAPQHFFPEIVADKISRLMERQGVKRHCDDTDLFEKIEQSRDVSLFQFDSLPLTKISTYLESLRGNVVPSYASDIERAPKQDAFVPRIVDYDSVTNPVTLFQHFCGRCHSFNDALGFLNPRNDIESALVSDQWREKILERLNDDGSLSMPPPSTEEREHLYRNGQVKERMKNFLLK